MKSKRLVFGVFAVMSLLTSLVASADGPFYRPGPGYGPGYGRPDFGRPGPGFGRPDFGPGHGHPDFGRPDSGMCATMYWDSDYRGASLVAYSFRDVAGMPPGWNDKVSSINIRRGCELTLFQDSGFRGQAITVRDDIYNLKALGFNDKVSSYSCKCYR